MKYIRLTNVPIVGRYVYVGEDENRAIEETLTEKDRLVLGSGQAVVLEYTVGHVHWPSAQIKRGQYEEAK